MRTLILLLVANVLAWSCYGSVLAQAGAINPITAPDQRRLLNTADHAPNSILDGIEQELLHKQVRPEAISQLTDLINHDPRNYRAHLLMGNYCDDLGLPEQAIVQYRLAFKYGPNQPEACLDLIQALVKSGEVNAAGSLLKQAVERFPNNPQVLLCAGNSLFAQGKSKEAEPFYRQAMQEAKEPVMGLSTALGRLQVQKNIMLLLCD